MGSRRSFRCRATVLGRTVVGEHDLILTLLDETGEQRRAVAKGVRKGKSRLSARCDYFCESDFLIYQGKNLDVISDAASVDAHHGITVSPEKIAAASAVCEIAQLTSFEESTDPFLHPILSRALSAVEQASDRAHLDLVAAAYAFKVLAHSGWRPELVECASCGDGNPLFFSVIAGGLICASCAQTMPDAEPLAPSQAAWLRSCIGLTFDELLAAPIDPDTALFLLGAAHAWAATQLSARLKAFEFALSL
ncbi:MAG: DNA repair protein RecO [Coriobacteriaceae bacterium]|nr:DNA repair protein RecO [Coriobacteriaceae bacterium]